jgi:hypothetical protein
LRGTGGALGDSARIVHSGARGEVCVSAAVGPRWLGGRAGHLREDAYAREPSGGEYVCQGKEKLREAYFAQLANGGGIPLERCTLTDDCVRCTVDTTARVGGNRYPAPGGRRGLRARRERTSGRRTHLRRRGAVGRLRLVRRLAGTSENASNR